MKIGFLQGNVDSNIEFHITEKMAKRRPARIQKRPTAIRTTRRKPPSGPSG